MSELEKSELIEVNEISKVIKGAVEPFAESQKTAALEATKQTEIIAQAKTKMFWGICALMTLIIALAAYALFLGKDHVTEKVLIAIVSFMGGLGIGKQQK